METWHTDDGKGWTFDLLGRSLDALRIAPRAVLHVGGHHGEELPYYRDAGFSAATVVEPDPLSVTQIETVAAIMRNDGMAVEVLTLACGSIPGRTRFHRNELTFFSGLEARRRGRHRDVDTFRVNVVKVSGVQAGHDVLVIDTQGTELDALKSADLSRAAGVELLIIECYETGPGKPKVPCAANFDDTVRYLSGLDWIPTVRWVYDRSGYFDVLFTRRERLNHG